MINLKWIGALKATFTRKAHRDLTDPDDHSFTFHLNNDAFDKEQRRRTAEVERLTYTARQLMRRDM